MKNFCLPDADMPAAPEKITDTIGYTRMIMTEGIVFECGSGDRMYCHFRYRKPCEGKSEVYWTNITDSDAPIDRIPIYIELKSNYVYDGEISDGFPNGNGCMRFINAQTMMTTQFDEGDCWSCQGEFSCGIPPCKGKITGRDGFLMEGMFENGLLVEGSWFNMKNDAVFCREGTFYHGVLYGKSCHTRDGSLVIGM